MAIFKLYVLLAVVALSNALVAHPNAAGEASRIQALIDEAATAAPVEKRDDVPAGYANPPYYPAPPGGWVSGMYLKFCFKE